MHKLLITSLLFVMLLTNAYLAEAQFNIGPMLAYDSKSDLGLGVKAKIPLLDKIQVSPSAAYFSTQVEGIKSRSGEINTDAQYYFNPNGETMIYGVLGINLGLSKVSGLGDDGLSVKMGLNIGAGAEIEISETIQGFGQARYTLRKTDRLGIQTGIYFSFGGA